MAGAAVGLLFGVPRFSRAGEAELRQAGLANNTNLVDVSDWLSKLLLGATLSQLGDIPGFVWAAADALAQPEILSHRPVTAAALVYYAAAGFPASI